MRRAILIAFILTPSLAWAQRQIIWLDFGDPPDVASEADAGTSDAGVAPFRTEVTDTGLIIEHGTYVPPPPAPPPPPPPKNPREAYEEAITKRAKQCIAAHAVDATTINVTFSYHLTMLSTVATLDVVEDVATVLVPWLHVALLHLVGDRNPINIEEAHNAFVQCATDVALPTPVAVAERLSFRIRRGVKKLYVRDVKWSPLAGSRR